MTIVGIGASAGGLEAISQVIGHLPPDTGIAVVIVQHLARDHASILPELLQAETRLPVVQVTGGMHLEPGRVHVIPPDADMTISGGILKLISRPEQRTYHTPIDSFLCSLAAYAQSRAVAVILSGTGSDGTIGVREIKAAGGFVIAQNPDSARYNGMPQAAIATGVVDAVLPPREIAEELVRIAQHPLLCEPIESREDLTITDPQLDEIHRLLRDVSGVDFTHYRQPTIRRRIQRRMILHRTTRVDEYLEFLRKDRGEVEHLYRDVLIHVTRFFREPDSFKALASVAFPKMLEDRRRNEPVRVWIPGCSTGEEAYSVAITLVEFLGEEAAGVPIQIFGTDVSEEAIEQARAGSYSGSVESDISKERLARFFNKTETCYRISKAIREMCVFARQDVTRDAPFSRLDLIVCRNLLIYLGPNLQKRLISLFHYALKPSRYLLLGASESIGHTEHFALIDKKHRLFIKGPTAIRPDLEFATVFSGARHDSTRKAVVDIHAGTLQKEVDRLILTRFGPPAVVVDADFEIVQTRGKTGPFLELHPGEASLNVLKMAREGLMYVLRSALAEARNTGKQVRKEGVRVRPDGPGPETDIEVVPLTGTADTRHYLILFERHQPAPRPMPRLPEEKAPADPENTRLRDELAANREYLQSIIQDLEAANEELQSANEEILSSNEELQSTNEELDTAREELQSTNEELNTVNEELQARNEELNRVNSDLTNLLGSVQIAIVIVAADLRIRRFTPMAQQAMNLIPTDIGRPIGDIKPNIDCPDLEELIATSIERVEAAEREVRDRRGNWFALRIRPYKTAESRIEGAIISLFDVTRMREQEEEIRRARDFAEAIIETVHQPIAVLDRNLRVDRANRAFRELYPGLHENIQGRPLEELSGGIWSTPEVRSGLARIAGGESRIETIEVDLNVPGRQAQRTHLRASALGGSIILTTSGS